MGERRNREVALVTGDLRLYHRLVPVFEKRGIPLLGLTPQDEVPESVQALLNGPPDDPRHVPVHQDDDATLLAALQRLDRRRPGPYGHVTFGVDPGKTIGLAVVADDEPLLVREAQTIAAAIDRLCAWAEGLQSKHWAIHIGDGAPDVGEPLAEQLAQQLPDAPVRLIHEARTTPRAPVTGSRHADAAVRIALRRN